MDDIDRELGHLFDAARDVTEPTFEDRRRIRAAVAAKLGSGVVLSATSAKAAAGAGGASVGGFLGKGLKLALLKLVGPGLLAGTLLGGAASLAVSATIDTGRPPAEATVTPTESRRPSEPLRPLANVSPHETLPAVTAPVPSPRPSPRAVADAPRAALSSAASVGSAIATFPQPKTQPATSDLGRELSLVSRIHQAWQRGDWAGVRTAIRTHEQEFPRGTLTEEREAVKVMLSCRSADPARALELGSAFATTHPGSTHAARVAAVCGARR